MKTTIASIILLLLAGCATNERPAEVVTPHKPTKNIAPKSAYYLVKSGDTVASIASRFNISALELLNINNLKPGVKLVPGQRLLVKSRGKQIEQKLADDITVKPLEDNSVVQKPLSEVVSLDTPTPVNANSPAAAANSGYKSPVSGNIIKAYGQQPDGSFNKGINIAAPKGVPVKAVSDGVVKYAGSKAEGYGKMVMIKHADGKISTYAHLNTIDVKTDAAVIAGSKIGTVGSTGNVPQPQLHLQIRGPDKSPIDPATLIAGIS